MTTAPERWGDGGGIEMEKYHCDFGDFQNGPWNGCMRLREEYTCPGTGILKNMEVFTYEDHQIVGTYAPHHPATGQLRSAPIAVGDTLAGGKMSPVSRRPLSATP